MLGKKHSKRDYDLAPVRRRKLGHNFDTNDLINKTILDEIND